MIRKLCSLYSATKALLKQQEYEFCFQCTVEYKDVLMIYICDKRYDDIIIYRMPKVGFTFNMKVLAYDTSSNIVRRFDIYLKDEYLCYAQRRYNLTPFICLGNLMNSLKAKM